jgi:phosphoribosylformimino-5-aminoimidazole carboxamide ribotide isomerase
MELIPAIDIRDGACVRLFKGNFDEVTRYDTSPVELARRYRRLGARWLHVVDLDGAKSGAPRNLGLIREISADCGLKIQLGGGIRDEESLGAALEVADRVVLGSLSIDSVELVREWLDRYGPERFTLGFDVRLDATRVPRITTHGWTRATSLSLDDAIESYRAAGLAHVLCTDVERDGALSGPNLELYARSVRQWPDIAFQASGGVRHALDLYRLAAIPIEAAISGKALLEGKLSDEEIQRFLPNA